jgi:hypothetical protein
MRNKTIQSLSAILVCTVLFALICWTPISGSIPELTRINRADDTLDLPGLILHIPNSWKRSAGIGRCETCAGYQYENYMQRNKDGGIVMNCNYNTEKKGWYWYNDLPLSHWTKMNFSMSTSHPEATYKNGKKKIVLKSFADLKDIYYPWIWSNFTGAIGDPVKTIIDTVLANGKQARVTHISYLTKGFDSNFKDRLEVWEKYQVLYWSDALKKPVIFGMEFHVFEFTGQSFTDEKYGQIFLDAVRPKEPEMNDYFNTFLANLEWK